MKLYFPKLPDFIDTIAQLSHRQQLQVHSEMDQEHRATLEQEIICIRLR